MVKSIGAAVCPYDLVNENAAWFMGLDSFETHVAHDFCKSFGVCERNSRGSGPQPPGVDAQNQPPWFVVLVESIVKSCRNFQGFRIVLKGVEQLDAFR